jgi:hypothetical protein
MKKTKQLLVEGKDDLNVVMSIAMKKMIPETFEIIDTQGYENLRGGLTTRIRNAGLDTLGLIVDADLDISGRWQSLKAVFEHPEFGYELPNTPQYGGTIVTHSDIENTIFPQKIGVWLMPDNKKAGMLEDFLRMIVQSNDILMPLAEESIDNVQAKVVEAERFSDIHQSKALMHTWLAWQNEPGKPFGQAFTRSYFDKNAELVNAFADWLTMLFS